MKQLPILIILLAFFLNATAQEEISTKDCRFSTSKEIPIKNILEGICNHYNYELYIQIPNELLDKKVRVAFDLVDIESDMKMFNYLLNMGNDWINLNYGIIYGRKVVVTSINNREHPPVKIEKWGNWLVLNSIDGTMRDILQTWCKHFGYQAIITGKNANHKIDCVFDVVNLEHDLENIQRLIINYPPHPLPFNYTIEKNIVKINFE